MTTSAKVNIFGYIPDDINYFHLIVKFHSILREITKTNSLANHDFSAVWLNLTKQNLDKCRFSGSVISNYTQLLIPGKIIEKIIQNNLIRPETLANVVCFKYFISDISRLHF